MIIEYETDKEGWLATQCPHGINITGQQVCQVGSASCVDDCKYFAEQDKEAKTLICLHDQEYFFLEYEGIDPLSVIKKMERFRTEIERNLFIKALNSWKSIRVIRFGQGYWENV